MKIRRGATIATTVAVSRPARYQTMKFRLVMGRLSPSASELGVTSLEMALLAPYRYSTTGENLPQPTRRPGVPRRPPPGPPARRRAVGLAALARGPSGRGAAGARHFGHGHPDAPQHRPHPERPGRLPAAHARLRPGHDPVPPAR